MPSRPCPAFILPEFYKRRILDFTRGLYTQRREEKKVTKYTKEVYEKEYEETDFDLDGSGGAGALSDKPPVSLQQG